MTKKDPNKPGVVYVVTDSREPDRVRYVGRTVQGLRVRVVSHWSFARGGKSGAFQNWLRSRMDRVDDVVFTIISEHPNVHELNRAETQAIFYYRSMGQADLNKTDGGDGGWGRVMTEEQARAHRERVPRGEGHWQHKLTWESVREIRTSRMSTYLSDREMAKKYGVSRASVTSVLANELWFDPNFDKTAIIRPPREGDFAANKKLDWEKVREIRNLRTERYETASAVATRYGVTKDMIWRILEGLNWIDPDFDPSRIIKRAAK